MDRGITSRIAVAMRDLAEIALEAKSQREYRTNAFKRICAALSMDSLALNYTKDGASIHVEAHALDAVRLRDMVTPIMAEISTDEMSRCLSNRAFFDDEVFASERRASMLLYREYLAPEGIARFCAQASAGRHGFHWVTVAREGRNPRYSEKDIRAIGALFPMLLVGEALHASAANERVTEDERWAWASERRIAPSEYQVIDLVERGLTNAEIATALGRSTFTVRNQLASAFQKLNVSSRTELVFEVGNAVSDRVREVPTKQTALSRFIRQRSREGLV